MYSGTSKKIFIIFYATDIYLRAPQVYPLDEILAYFAQLNTLKNTIFRLLAGLGGRRGVMVARLVFQLFVLDPLNLI